MDQHLPSEHQDPGRLITPGVYSSEVENMAPAPKTDADCSPYPCRAFHGSWEHLEGRKVCLCPCHAKPRRGRPPKITETEHRAMWGDR